MRKTYLLSLAIALVLALAWSIKAPAQLRPQAIQLHTEQVEYRQSDTVLQGYLAYNNTLKGKHPAVLVIHEWTGLGPYIRQRTEQLAKLGYVAFAPDIYGKGVRPQNPQAAAAQAKIYRSDRQLMRARAKAGLAELQKHPLTDPERIAAIGYCFGGGTVLELARSGADIAGVVSFHGNLDTPNLDDAKNIKGKVLVLHGADDPLVPVEQVLTFATEMQQAGVDWQLVNYGGAVHAFTNPEAGNDPAKGTAYNAQADRRSFTAMQLFFAELFH